MAASTRRTTTRTLTRGPAAITGAVLATLPILGVGIALSPAAQAERGNRDAALEGRAAASRPGTLPDSVPAWFDGPRVPGIDVSHWNPGVNYAAWKRSGRAFVWIKATDGIATKDQLFASHYAASAKAGMLRGPYHFARPQLSNGIVQARFLVKVSGAWKNDGRTLPAALDMESPLSGASCYGKSQAQMVAWIKAFDTEYARLTKRHVIIYTSNSWWTQCTGNSIAFAASNRLWLARYADTPRIIPGGWDKPDVWQWGDVAGMDHNIWFGTRAELDAWTKGN